MSAVGLVHVQDSVGSGAGTGEGIKDQSIFIASYLQNTLNQAGRFWCVKSCFPIKNCSQNFCRLIGMPNISILP